MMRQTIIFFLLVFFLSGCSDEKIILSWNTQIPHSENYRLTQQVGLENGAPERTYDRALTLEFLGNNQLNVTVDTTNSGPLTVTQGGHIRVNKDTVPPFDVNVFLRLLPQNGVIGVSIGDSWENFFPSDQALQNEPDTLSLQDRYRVEVTGIRKEQGSQLVDLLVSGDVRLVANNWLASSRVPANASAEMLTTLAALQQWSPNISGTATFDASNNRLHSADISFLLVPRVGLTRNDITTSEHRRRVIAVIN